jgi:hypothetical protein
VKRWLRRTRGAVGMGLTWAAGWAVVGLLIGVASILLPGLPWDSFFEVFDAPLPALAVPGFFAGALFSTVLGIAGRRRRFDELSLPRFAAWGALGGVLLTLLPFALVAVGLASREGSNVGTWQIIATLTGPFVVLSALSASVTLMLARNAEGQASRDVGLSGGEAQARLEGASVAPHAHPDARPGEPARPGSSSGSREG